ncbi:unnamed protein product [Auanema sp. JU1783]|nr:unnamed protein product [Auanema sp. JU1783]
MNFRAFSQLCLLVSVFSTAFALDTCNTEAIGPCLDNLCPTNYTCTKDHFCCSTPDVKTTTCADVALNCPDLSTLCDHPHYVALLTSECAKTCGRC